jgi:hypothetical protein
MLLQQGIEGGGNFSQHYFAIKVPRAKFNEASIGDAVAEGLPITMSFRGLLPTDWWDDPSQIVFQTGHSFLPPTLSPPPAALLAGARGLVAVASDQSDTTVSFTAVGTATAAEELAISFDLSGDKLDQASVLIPAGTTAAQAAALVATALDALPDLTAAVNATDATKVDVTVAGETIDLVQVSAYPAEAPVAPPVVVPPATPVTVVAGGVGTATATLTVGAAPAAQANTVTVTSLTVGGTAIAGLTPVAVATGDTAAAIATALATMLGGKQDAGATLTLAAVTAAGVVTVIETGGGLIDALTVTVT